MPRKWTEEEAVTIALEWGFTPKVPYPGSQSKWAGVCNICNGDIEPKLFYRNSSRSKGSPCKFCNKSNGQRLKSRVARERMLNCNLYPVAEYVNSKIPWYCICLLCGDLTSKSLAVAENMPNNGGCTNCNNEAMAVKSRADSQELEELCFTAGFSPSEPYRTSNDPWKGTCVECGSKVEVSV